MSVVSPSVALRAPDPASRLTLIDRLAADRRGELDALARSLQAPAASIPPKYFYDPLGCALYGAIVLTPEYYLTRTESAIFDAHRSAIAARAGRCWQFVDLGSGDSAKAERWFPVLRPARYIAVDIARDALANALERLAGLPDRCELVGLATDFSPALDLSGVLERMPTLFFYPGSSIGNFAPNDALRFLRQVREYCSTPACGLLIGVDSRKDPRRLQAAYDDELQVTAAFNRNVLRHVNRVLHTDFDPAQWRHVARFDDAESRIEMHLEAVRAVTVDVRGHRRRFACGERIHTENSYKYDAGRFASLLEEAGFGKPQLWQDARRDFLVFYAPAQG